MTFEEILDQAIAMLQRRRRVTYRTLQLHFQLDDEHLEALKEAIIDGEQVAVDEAGKILVWAPRWSAQPVPMMSVTIRNGLVLLLACVAGGVDAVSYIALGRVFTANMTGNTVLLGLALGQAESQAVVRSGLALVGFLAGVAVGTWTATRGRDDSLWPPAITVTLALEGGLLVALAVGWYLVDELAVHQVPRTALIWPSALAMGIQSAVGRYFNISGITTTYITGTLTSLVARLVIGIRGTPALQLGPERSGPAVDPLQLPANVGLLAATWGLYLGGAAAAAMLIVLVGPLLAFTFPIALLIVVILTAMLHFRRS